MKKSILISASIFTVLLLGAQIFAAPNPERDAYFGETHVHTSWSLDAFAIGNILTTPGDAYKYFKGEPIKHPLGYEVKIDTPLDLGGRHRSLRIRGRGQPGERARLRGQQNPCGAAAHPESQDEGRNAAGRSLRHQRAGVRTARQSAHVPRDCRARVWKKNVALADEANVPGKFTAFCSYEWTSMPNNMNMHRNIFFKDSAKVPPQPFSALDSVEPWELWNWMDTQRKAGNELLAISHNANLSDGRMFPTEVDIKGRPVDAAWAASRDRNEKLTEMHQLKGTSETHPLLSPSDEFANFELMSVLLGAPPGRVPHIVGSYARQALKDGLTLQDTKGFNPYKFGFGAASDSHNTAVPYRQDNFFGGHTLFDGTIEARMSGNLVSGMFDARTESTSGLTGVWAEENTRASIFDGMARKETFGVSGPHIKVRMFGGWEYDAGMMAQPDWVKTGYAKGVPMGGDLPPAKAKAPTFAVWAVKDPTSGNLDRIQIVKGWTKSGQSFEKIFDVVWAGDRKPNKWTGVVPPIENTVDIDNATYKNSVGSVELKTVWTDPEFDPSVPAFYYARVLEIPTPRWTTIQAHKLGIAPPDVVSATLQERAWGSPIWYSPSEDARKAGKPGTTVADLKKKGAVALNDAELKKLIVRKSVWLQNSVTGDKYMIIYGDLGRGDKPEKLEPIDPGYVTQRFPVNQGELQIRYVTKKMPLQSLTGDPVEASYRGTSQTYNIQDGKIVTSLVGTPIETTVYKVGDKYLAARNNEFGYANYEIIPAVAEIAPVR